MENHMFSPGDRVVCTGRVDGSPSTLWVPGKAYVVNSFGLVEDDETPGCGGGWEPGRTFNFALAPSDWPAAEDKVLGYLKARVAEILDGDLPGDLEPGEYGQFYEVSKALEDLYGVRVGTRAPVQIYFTQTPDAS